MKTKLIITGLCILLIVLSGCIKRTIVNEDCTYVGTVEDFEVSAGGFGECDLAKVILTDGNKIVVKCKTAEKLTNGLKIYRCNNGHYFAEGEDHY